MQSTRRRPTATRQEVSFAAFMANLHSPARQRCQAILAEMYESVGAGQQTRPPDEEEEGNSNGG